MKNIYLKSFIYFLSIFFTVSILLTSWLIYDFENFNTTFNTIQNVFFRYGCIGGLIPAIFFLVVFLSLKNIKSKWLLIGIIIISTVLLIHFIIQFVWYFIISGLIDNPFSN